VSAQPEDDPRAFDLSMTVEEALRKGLVARVHPRWTCGSRSPETSTLCNLEPGHEGAHWGRDGAYSTVGWSS